MHLVGLADLRKPGDPAIRLDDGLLVDLLNLVVNFWVVKLVLIQLGRDAKRRNLKVNRGWRDLLREVLLLGEL